MSLLWTINSYEHSYMNCKSEYSTSFVFIDNTSFLCNGRFSERERERERSKNVSGVQERNIYAETLMQSHSDSGITHVYQDHESHIRRANLPEVIRLLLELRARDVSRLSVACDR